MPGHVKKGDKPTSDPDPMPYLHVSYEEKQKDMAKPYDSKRSCWVPLKEGGFAEGVIESAEGDKVNVKVEGERRILKKDQVQQVNPPKFERCEDMSNLTYLNEASVLYNLKARYVSKMIYSYSGLFCVAVNPYKRYPIYTQTTINMYMNKRRNEVPPHIFAIADGSYQSMLTHGKNQSILITGESGAGKTENTKKVIGYFASVGASGKSTERKNSLEDQIVQTNPILEAFGNAKTVRNDNSSRFGKFIKIYFNQAGKLSGADMEIYLLEKSRITYQQSLERSFHIFYNLMSDAIGDIKKVCFLSNNVKDYHYVSQGKVTVDSIDDKEDMIFADEAFDILGFSKEDKYNVYKCTATVMHLGEIKFKQKSSKDDQAIPDGTEAGEIVCKLLGLDSDIFYENFRCPKIKVGSEWVTKGQTTSQAINAVSGIARAIFEKQFRYLAERCNESLVDLTMRRISFIGVLDIAGFEIFDFNGFEQMCINFCNEKLQQFFNHHMFVLEQEEYLREGIEWAMVDFGMDLQKCIDMFEKPMGVLSILEEESLFPKATDKTFEEKLIANHLGKSPTFQKPKPGGSDKNAHFAVIHYAGTVSYNLTNWLEKNKDPLNDTVVDQIKRGTNKLVVEVFRDHPGQGDDVDKDSGGGGKKKKGGGKTVSSFYKDQLNNLMKTLHATEPHFIRCIVPNTHKTPGVIDAVLVMHQLTCNGVLEGIRICRKGFPNRMIYEDFKHRYSIQNLPGVKALIKMHSVSEASRLKLPMERIGHKEKMDRKITVYLLKTAYCIQSDRYRLGHTKVFFRAGVLGLMEEIREQKVSEIVRWIQAAARGWSSRRSFKKMQDQKLALYSVQRTIRNFMIGKNWLWWKLWLLIKPNLRSSKFEEIRATLEAKTLNTKNKLNDVSKVREEAEAINVKLTAEKAEMEKCLTEGGSASHKIEDRVRKLEAEKKKISQTLDGVEKKLAEEEETRSVISNGIKKLEDYANRFREDIKHSESKMDQCQEDKITKESQIRSLREELSHQEELVAKLVKDKKGFAENRQKTDEELQAAEDRANHLSKIKIKLENNLDEIEDSVERERKSRSESEKSRRKIEADIQFSEDALNHLEANKVELSNNVQRKEKELSAISAKIEDEQTLVNKMQKQCKQLNTRLDDLEEELEGERNNRLRAEKTRQKLSRDLEEMGERLEECGNDTASQIELNRRRELELTRLKDELDNASLNHETGLSSLRQKHNAVIADIGDQIDQLNRAKSKAEQQKGQYLIEMNDIRAAVEELTLEKVAAEKYGKTLQCNISEASGRFEDHQASLSDADFMKKKLFVEKTDMERQIEESENQLKNLGKLKMSLKTQLDDTKHLADAENRDRTNLLGKFRSLQADLERLHQKIEIENNARGEIHKQMSRALADAQMWKAKYNTDALIRIEDLEHAKGKIMARIEEAEECISGLNEKLAFTEKIKNKYHLEVDYMQSEFDRINTQLGIAEKKFRNFDKVVKEWNLKCEDLSSELEASQRDSRNQSSEMFRMKSAWDEAVEQLDSVRRENKNLSDEIKDLLDQLGEGGRSIHELDKQRRRLQVEKEELGAALEEAESALEREENKVLRSQIEIQQAKQDVDRRLQEKEEEFENTKKNFLRVIDSLQVSLDGEINAKQEALRMKKKIESDINEMEMSLDQANKANVEAMKQIKRSAASLSDIESTIEEEGRIRSDIEDQVGSIERKVNVLMTEFEESKILLDSADRAKRNAEFEVAEIRESISELTTVNALLCTEKRRLEADMRSMQQELEELILQVKNSEEKSKKAIADAGRLADELHTEQIHTDAAVKKGKALNIQCSQLSDKLDEVESNAATNARKMIAKLEERIKALESELSSIQTRFTEAHKGAIRADRKSKEMQFVVDENRKNMERMTELVEKLQGKIRTYKKHIEDAEEIAALNLAKFRKAQQQLEECDERSQAAECHIAKARGQRESSAMPFY